MITFVGLGFIPIPFWFYTCMFMVFSLRLQKAMKKKTTRNPIQVFTV